MKGGNALKGQNKTAPENVFMMVHEGKRNVRRQRER
jgi:hypothetical protein